MVNHPFDIPSSKKIRLIINTDAKNEADDQYAIVHALLTPRFQVRGIIGAQFGEPKSEMWHLGDNPAVSVLLDDHEFGYELRPAPRIAADMTYIHTGRAAAATDEAEVGPAGAAEVGSAGAAEAAARLIRWYHYIDPRFTLEDMFAKLKLHYGEK